MPTLSRHDAEDLLYEEARLLDERRYDDWMAMLTGDAVYWLPLNGSGGDPNREISIIHDDFAQLRDRIGRLATGVAHAQSPPSRTARLISNVEASQAAENNATIHSAFVLYELRRGKQLIYAGRCEHRLRFDGRWKIAFKKAVLVNNDEVIDNLTFIV